MRIVARILGLFFILAALLVLAADLAGDGPGPRPLGALWYDLHAPSLNLTQAVIERYVWAPLWDPVVITVLQWPAALVFGVLGAVLLGLGFVRLPARPEETSAAQPAEGDNGAVPRS